jgi:hypothetical protein
MLDFVVKCFGVSKADVVRYFGVSMVILVTRFDG